MPQPEVAGSSGKSNVVGARTRGAERHGFQDGLAGGAFVVGLIALILGWIPATHFFGALAGVIGFPLALYSQMTSKTTGERWLNVIGLVASFVGFGFALRHGGFGI
ncbi:hypothetical protein [Actinomadura oligospora]|uniref:hypothetical protein n=1 Tax=Actinomadura oligospora TaxID=111804 RepID=UPI0004B4A525|nr:hypothetical protein [Actinomadura oligospora]